MKNSGHYLKRKETRPTVKLKAWKTNSTNSRSMSNEWPLFSNPNCMSCCSPSLSARAFNLTKISAPMKFAPYCNKLHKPLQSRHSTLILPWRLKKKTGFVPLLNTTTTVVSSNLNNSKEVDNNNMRLLDNLTTTRRWVTSPLQNLKSLWDARLNPQIAVWIFSTNDMNSRCSNSSIFRTSLHPSDSIHLKPAMDLIMKMRIAAMHASSNSKRYRWVTVTVTGSLSARSWITSRRKRVSSMQSSKT
jgi:hypothetical protein